MSPSVYSDKYHMTILLSNLIENAIAFSELSSTINIKIESMDEDIFQFSITNKMKRL